MKERPILFSAPMVRAILEGRKTQTRRVAKARPTEGSFDGYSKDALDAVIRNRCPYGQPGDRLWVRETWGKDPYAHLSGHVPVLYKVGPPSIAPDYPVKWKPSIHMPRWASRITLEITGVRVERLNEITEADARAEGVECFDDTKTFRSYWNDFCVCLSAKDSFQTLWAKINGPDSWDANPWVWVVEFRRV